MNALDIGLLVLAGVLVLFGLIKGFVRLLVTIAALAVAFVLASRLHQEVASRFTPSRVPIEVLSLAAYIAIFLAVMLLGGVLAWLLSKLMKAALLGWLDRLAGAATGLLAAILAGALLILPLVAYSASGDRITAASRFASYLSAVADAVTYVCPEDLAEKYNKKIEHLRKLWRGEEPIREAVLKVKEKAKEIAKPSPPDKKPSGH